MKNQNGNVVLLLVAILGITGALAAHFHGVTLRHESTAYTRANGTVQRILLRQTVIDLIDCKKVLDSCATNPADAQLVSRRPSSTTMFPVEDGYQTAGGWRFSVDCVPDGVLVNAQPVQSDLLGVMRRAKGKDDWILVLHESEVFCEECAAIPAYAASHSYPFGICREAL